MIKWMVLFFAFSCGPAKKLPEYKSAQIQLLDSSHEKIFFRLPSEGHSSKNFWSSSIWNKEKEFINWRWNSSVSESQDYSSPYQIQVFLMTDEELAALSPSEKFDLLRARYDYPLREEASGLHENSIDPVYAWQLASYFHPEPQVKTMINPDGLAIPFGSSDIKALLSYHYGRMSKTEVGDSIGKVCGDEGCKGRLDPGTFHVTLTNKLGRKSETFFVDVNPLEKVEARLAIKYKSTILDELFPTGEVPYGTVNTLKILNQLTFLDSSSAPSWEPSGGSFLIKEYHYYLYLNLKNEIIGGKWLNPIQPDSLWIIKENKTSDGLLQGLDQLLVD
jgi:hypothetical protein